VGVPFVPGVWVGGRRVAGLGRGVASGSSVTVPVDAVPFCAVSV
jgi:hypothetical protein